MKTTHTHFVVAGVVTSLGLVGLALAQLETKPIQVSQNYHGPEGSIELVGVCRVTTEVVACWKSDGKSNNELRADVLSYLRRNSGLTLTYGRKTRYAFFRIKHNPQSPTSMGRLRGYFQSSGWDLTDRSLPSSLERESVRGVPLISDTNAKMGSVQTSIERHARPSDPLKLEAGAKLTYLGGTVTVLRVAKSEANSAFYGQEPTPRWIIHLAYEGDPLSSGSWVPHDGDGIRVMAVDAEGKPVVVDPQVLSQLENRWGVGASSARPNIFQARIMGSSGGYQPIGLLPGENMIVTNINPAMIKHIVLHASGNQPLTITDIPLDPR